MAESAPNALAYDDSMASSLPCPMLQDAFSINSRVASYFIAISASMNCTAWNCAMGCPNALRSSA